jgi:glycosyltransferase involved in cell wall biosynthesis
MRVLQVITDRDRRGAQVFAVDLEAALRLLGHEVTTVALAPGTRSARLDVPVLGEHARGMSTLRALRRQMGEADITVAHGSSTLLACSLAGAGRGRPFVYRQISNSRYWAPTWWRRLRVATYLRAPRRVVALSNAAASDLIEYLHVPASRIDVVANGVARGAFRPATAEARAAARTAFDLPHDAFVVLCIGALTSEKGTHIAVEATASTECHLMIVGGGPDRERIEALAATAAPGRVHILGDLSDVLPAYCAADAVVLPSFSESMPATLIEAGLCGLAAVGTPVGSITDIVLHERTGLIVPVRDVAATAAAFERLRIDPVLRAAFGSAAEQHCTATFEIGVVAQGWQATLERALR